MARSTGIVLKREATSKDTIRTSSATTWLQTKSVNSLEFLTENPLLLLRDFRIDVKYLESWYIRVPIQLFIGLNGTLGVVSFGRVK